MSDPITQILELARRVRTPEGAKLYNKPVGSLIDTSSPGGGPGPEDGPVNTSSMPKDAPGRTTGSPSKAPVGAESTRAVTVERIRSLQQQLRAAARTDNEAALKLAQKAFNEAVTEFTKDRSPAEVLKLLASGKKK